MRKIIDTTKTKNFNVKNEMWSFSKINSYLNCPYGFYLNYIIKNKNRVNNAFAEYGTIIHNIEERYVKGELFNWDLNDEFIKLFSKMKHRFPYNKYVNLKEAYFNQGKEYFNNYEGIGSNQLLEVENRHLFNVGEYRCQGYIDRVVKNNQGEIIIEDIKTSKPYKGKDLRDKIKQLYLYSTPIYNRYNKYPDKLRFIFTREQDEYVEDFSMDEFEKTEQWVINVIGLIAKEEKWKANNSSEFFCKELCGQRLNCDYIFT